MICYSIRNSEMNVPRFHTNIFQVVQIGTSESGAVDTQSKASVCFFYCYVFSTASGRLSFYGRWKTKLCFASYEILSPSSFQPLFLSISRFAVWFARTFHGLPSRHFFRVMSQSIPCKIFNCIKKKTAFTIGLECWLSRVNCLVV